jgi:UDP-GlcNAc:undecaprenyl-phosphate GlcNAc-1-phosphate transferase
MLQNLLLYPAAFATFLSVLLTPIVIALAWRVGLIDDPKKNKHPKVTHTKPTPRGGGLAVFFAILLSCLVFLPLDKHLLGILSGATLLVIVGLLDDKYNLNPYLRFCMQIVAAGLPILAGIGIAFWNAPLLGVIDLSHPRIVFELFGETRSIWVFSDLLALIWIISIINFLNMGAKGVDGQLTGVVVIAAATIALLSLRFSADITEWPVIILASIVMGAHLGFLPWHIFPQKIMPSFSGSNLAGYMLAILALLTTTKVGVLMVVLAVPIIDTGYTIIRRLRSGKSPFWGDRGHLHHKLIDELGLSRSQVAIVYWLVSLLLGFLALNLNTSTKFYTIIGVAVFIGGVLLILTYRKTYRKK